MHLDHSVTNIGLSYYEGSMWGFHICAFVSELGAFSPMVQAYWMWTRKSRSDPHKNRAKNSRSRLFSSHSICHGGIVMHLPSCTCCIVLVYTQSSSVRCVLITGEEKAY